jgi:hypothetical protein
MTHMRNYLSYLLPHRDDADIKQMLSAAHDARMDEAAKTKTRALLQEYMEMRPIRSPQIEADQSRSRTIFIFERIYAVPITAVVLVFGMTAGTAFAAEGTLPGDLLYPVKVHVTEEVRGVLAITPEAKADWQIERAGKRLEEASTLAVQGKLTDANRTEIETDLADHVAATEKSAAALAASDNLVAADEVGAHLHAVLKAHGDILATVLPQSDAVSGISSDPLLAEVVGHLDSASRISAESEAAMASSTATIATTTELQQSVTAAHIASAQSYIASVSASEGSAPELVARASARLAAAEDAYKAGTADLGAGATTTALAHFSSALGTALDAETSLSAQSHLLGITLKLAADDTANGDMGSSLHPHAAGPDTSADANATGTPQTTHPTMRMAARLNRIATATLATSTKASIPASHDSVIRSVIGTLLHGTESATSTDPKGSAGSAAAPHEELKGTTSVSGAAATTSNAAD